MTPIQAIIKWMTDNWTDQEIQKDGYLKHFWDELQWQLPKEKEFAEKCWDAGEDFGVWLKSESTHYPKQVQTKQHFLDKLYPQS